MFWLDFMLFRMSDEVMGQNLLQTPEPGRDGMGWNGSLLENINTTCAQPKKTLCHLSVV